MEIKRAGTRSFQQGPEEYFTGDVQIEPIIDATEPSHLTGGWVTFAPGAHSNWHRHPLGQTLIVTAGIGWVQCEDGPVEEIRAGDVVWCPPNQKHWHGATTTTTMSHIAIQEQLDGRNIEWLERVTDEQYLAGLQIMPQGWDIPVESEIGA